jgi:hypothetical protein
VNYTLTAAEIWIVYFVLCFLWFRSRTKKTGIWTEAGGVNYTLTAAEIWTVFFVLYFLWIRSRTKKTGIWTEAGGVNYTLTAAEIDNQMVEKLQNKTLRITTSTVSNCQ